MEDKNISSPGPLVVTTELGENTVETPWVSPSVLAAENGEQVDFSMSLAEEQEPKEA